MIINFLSRNEVVLPAAFKCILSAWCFVVLTAPALTLEQKWAVPEGVLPPDYHLVWHDGFAELSLRKDGAGVWESFGGNAKTIKKNKRALAMIILPIHFLWSGRSLSKICGFLPARD